MEHEIKAEGGRFEQPGARVVRLGAVADTWIGEQLRHCVSRARRSAASSIA